MDRIWTHPQRYERLRQIETMDVDREFEAIYRLTSMVELPWEFRFGWNLAFYRSFAVPRMAALLAETGEIESRTMKRARDTGLMMYELFEQGLDHPRSREVIRRLNRMHRRWDIEQEDYRYILTTFAVVPTRFAEGYGWRPVSTLELDATYRFYRELGRRMGIGSIPGSYQAMADFLDEYEAREVRYSAEGQRLTGLTLPFLASRLPGPLRERTAEIAGGFLDPRLGAALGLPTPRRTTQAVVRGALTVRRAVVRRRPPDDGSWFTPGMVNATYPNGYRLSELGPGQQKVADLDK
jgi:uncharacterized protein (DUF2236 family)